MADAPNPYPRVMLVEEVAAYLRVNKQTIYNLVKQGKLPACKIGGQWRFDREVIDAFLRSSGQSPQPGSPASTPAQAPIRKNT